MITIVSGLPRSGTSLMMQILEKNGYEILTDSLRSADENNPLGYYEYEKVKSLMKDNSWFAEAEGKVLKVIAQLLPFLPLDFGYQVIFMERNIEEILNSQSKMLVRLGSNKVIPHEILKNVYKQQIEKSLNFIKQNSNFDFVKINYNYLFTETDKELESLNNGLSLNISKQKTLEALKPDLYRERI